MTQATQDFNPWQTITRLERQIEALTTELAVEKARADALAQVLRESNAACICGCPEDVHDRSGEDPDECGTCEHECLPCSAAVADAVSDLRQRERALVEALRDAIEGYADAVNYKGENLTRKHGDLEELDRLRGVLAPYDNKEAVKVDRPEDGYWQPSRADKEAR